MKPTRPDNWLDFFFSSPSLVCAFALIPAVNLEQDRVELGHTVNSINDALKKVGVYMELRKSI